MIKHVLADGRVLDSIEGFQIPYTPATEAAYRLLAEFWMGGGRNYGRAEKTRRAEPQEAQERE